MRSTWRKAGQVGVRKLFLSREYLAWIWSRQTKHVKYFDSQSAWNKIRMANSLTPALPHFGFWRLVPSGLQCSLLRYHEWNEITKCGNSAWGVRIWEGFVFCLSRVLCHLPSYFSPVSHSFKFHHMCACEYWFHWVDDKLHDPGFDLEEIVHCLTVRLAPRHVFSAWRYSVSLCLCCAS